MKDLKISKELLSEVLGYEVDTFLGINKNEIDYTCCRDKNEGYIDISINIYEFAFKCKEWASKKGYELYSYRKECFLYDTNELYDCSEQLSQWSEWFGADTEVEVIVKACIWILENKDNK